MRNNIAVGLLIQVFCLCLIETSCGRDDTRYFIKNGDTTGENKADSGTGTKSETDFDTDTDTIDAGKINEHDSFDRLCPMESLGSDLPMSIIGTTLEGVNLISPTTACSFFSNAPERTYGFQAPMEGLYRFRIIDAISIDPVLYLLANDCRGEIIACNDNSLESNLPELNVCLQQGQTVIVIVDEADKEIGGFTLKIDLEDSAGGSSCDLTNL